MRFITYLFICILLSSCINTNNEKEAIDYPFYVGTYTSGFSEGIYKYVLNGDGSFDSIGLAAASINPSFIIKSANNSYLIATNEVDSLGTGFVESFLISGDSLLSINRSYSGGAHPCHLDINDDGIILVSNYTGGNVGMLQLNQDGSLSDLIYVHQHIGRGTTDRQEAPHAHSSYFVPDRNQIISADLGTNELWMSILDKSGKSMLPDDPIKVILDKGAGPRHITIHPNGKWIYVINELNSSITHLDYNKEDIIRILESTSTLPDDFNGVNNCADIHISRNGKHLYASNRGHNSIAIFEINSKTGKLNALGHTTSHGKWPRNFSLTPDDKYLIVANRHSNNIVSFKRDKKTGLLEYLSQVQAPEPVCILF